MSLLLLCILLVYSCHFCERRLLCSLSALGGLSRPPYLSKLEYTCLSTCLNLTYIYYFFPDKDGLQHISKCFIELRPQGPVLCPQSPYASTPIFFCWEWYQEFRFLYAAPCPPEISSAFSLTYERKKAILQYNEGAGSMI